MNEHTQELASDSTELARQICVIMYGIKTWPMGIEDMRHLEGTEKLIFKWICEVTLRNGKASEEIRNRLGIASMSDLVRQGRIRWFLHVEHKDTDDLVSASRYVTV
jgi:hypothetical protein